MSAARVAHLGVGSAHDPGQADDAVAVGDGDHLAVELPLLVVQGRHPLARPGPPHDQRRPAERRRVVGVHRLVQLEHDVVGGVHHVVDRADTDRFQPAPQPIRGGGDRSAPDQRAVEPGAALGVLDRDRDPADRARRGRAPRRRHVHSLRARNHGQPERRAVRRGQLTRDALVTQQVRPIGGDIHHQAVVGQRDRLQERSAGGGIGLQLPDALAVVAQAQLGGRAEHAVDW